MIEGEGSSREDYTMTIKDEDVHCQQKGFILYVQHESLSKDNEDNNSCDCQYSVKLRRCMVDQSCGDVHCQQKGFILYVQHESLSKDNEDNNSCDCQYSVKLRRCMVDQSCGELCYSLYQYVESIADNVEWRYCEIEF